MASATLGFAALCRQESRVTAPGVTAELNEVTSQLNEVTAKLKEVTAKVNEVT